MGKNKLFNILNTVNLFLCKFFNSKNKNVRHFTNTISDTVIDKPPKGIPTGFNVHDSDVK